MGKIAILFSGQGAQYTGMGQKLCENSPAARAVFDLADALRPGTSEQCFHGTAEELKKTKNTQPCIYTVDLAAAAALAEAGIRADMTAGFSLGELAALTYSGAVDDKTGFKLVCRRGALMQKAAEEAEAAMVAVLRMEDEKVVSLCGEFNHVHPVNFNCPGQVVVAGAKNELEYFKLCVKELGGRTMPLNVSGAFHSPYMEQAAVQFAASLKNYPISGPNIPLYSDLTAQPYSGDCRALLSGQICNPVRWTQIIENMIEAGADTFIEAGPGKVLTGLVAKISDRVRVFHVEDMESLGETVREVAANA